VPVSNRTALVNLCSLNPLSSNKTEALDLITFQQGKCYTICVWGQTEAERLVPNTELT